PSEAAARTANVTTEIPARTLRKSAPPHSCTRGTSNSSHGLISIHPAEFPNARRVRIAERAPSWRIHADLTASSQSRSFHVSRGWIGRSSVRGLEASRRRREAGFSQRFLARLLQRTSRDA